MGQEDDEMDGGFGQTRYLAQRPQGFKSAFEPELDKYDCFP